MTRPIFARGMGTSPAGPAGPAGTAGPAGPAGANGGTDASTADNVTNGTATKAALSSAYAPKAATYASGVDYVVGQLVVSGTTLYRVITAHTSSGAIDLSKFAAAGGGTSGAAALTRTAVKTAATYTAAASDLVPVDTTSNAVTVTLPAAPADKAQVAVKLIIVGGTNTVTVACGGSDKFNRTSGATSMVLTLLGQGALYQYDATAAVWTVAEYAAPLSQLDTRYPVLTGGQIAASVVPASKTGLGGPTYNITPSAFKYWRKALSQVRSAQALGTPAWAKVMCVGDSTMAGIGSTDYRTAWTQQLATILAQSGYIATQTSSPTSRERACGGTVDTRVTYGSGWGEVGNIAGGLSLFGADGATGQVSYAFGAGVTFDTIDVYYVTNGSATAPTIRDGSTSIGTLPLTGSALEAKKTFTTTRGSGKTINIDGPVGNGVYITAIDCYDSQTGGARILNAGQGGSKIADWFLDPTNLRRRWWLDLYQPALVLVSLTINDSNAGIAEATWEAAQSAQIDTIRAAGADVLLVAGPPSGTAKATDGTLESFRQGLYRICDAKNVGLIDTISRFESYAVSNALGYYSDTLHLTGAGYSDMGQSVTNGLKTL